MNESLPIWIAVGVVVVLIVWMVIRRNKERSIEDRVLSIKRKTRSARGVNLWIEDGVSVSRECEDAFERGLLRAFEKAGCRGYTRQLNFDDYIIAVVKGEPDSNGDPAYRLPAGDYAGTVYDKGGYILVAGQMVFVGQPYGNVIAIPEHDSRFDHAALVAEFEAEHVILAWNDGPEFERTKYHGDGTGHPIIPDCERRELTERKTAKIFCGN